MTPDPDSYARGHALFEARSDQRTRIVSWLGDRLSRRAGDAHLSVLSVGCGDGTVDRALAARACAEAAPEAARSWTGVDPHSPGVASFVAGLEGLGQEQLAVRGHVGTFDSLLTGPDERFDVVVFVHSLYYVPDLDAALGRALDLLAPGGELLVLHAPLGALNELVADLAPPAAGGPQPWSDAVAASLARLPAEVAAEDLASTVDLDGGDGDDPALLDFTVQTVLDDAARAAVVERLRRSAEPGPGLRVAHPVTAFVVHPRGDAPPLRSGA